jgi:lipid-A-disaccharide synthase-like uncharacterized protein
VTTSAIVGISVLAYLVAGIATAALAILNHGEPPAEDVWILMAIGLLWPFFLLIDVPIFAVRWIKSRREARRAKPRAFSEEFDP